MMINYILLAFVFSLHSGVYTFPHIIQEDMFEEGMCGLGVADNIKLNRHQCIMNSTSEMPWHNTMDSNYNDDDDDMMLGPRMKRGVRETIWINMDPNMDHDAKPHRAICSAHRGESNP
ncbi:uncharacterized protein LOC143248326 [Tachypleus tridentatus]|uniref:uncharacterized protein LOC143248326 n=1 Tax=Tachypleus tridentatus TaxID=6853 RepID=UPI003FD3B6A7